MSPQEYRVRVVVEARPGPGELGTQWEEVSSTSDRESPYADLITEHEWLAFEAAGAAAASIEEYTAAQRGERVLP